MQKYMHKTPKTTFPIQGLPPMEENFPVITMTKKEMAENNYSTDCSFLEHKDCTLLFMTMSVTMTSKNEMPIVCAYKGSIPSDIRGIHRVVVVHLKKRVDSLLQ